jgi:molybdopterin synthase catalytic subunit
MMNFFLREADMVSRVQREDFDTEEELRILRGIRKDVGAVCCFVGLVRGEGEEGELEALELEHHEELSEKALAGLEMDLRARYDIEDCALIHRYGNLEVGSQIVMVLTLSRHRKDAFASASYAMDVMKTDIPFWKCEHYKGGGKRWLSP